MKKLASYWLAPLAVVVCLGTAGEALAGTVKYAGPACGSGEKTLAVTNGSSLTFTNAVNIGQCDLTFLCRDAGGAIVGAPPVTVPPQDYLLGYACPPNAQVLNVIIGAWAGDSALRANTIVTGGY